MRPFGGRLVDGRPGLARRAEMVCHCLLLETDDAGLVLVDTGVGSQATTRPGEWIGRPFRLVASPTLAAAETALHQIQRLGYAAADVRHIVLTHLDFDHAGGLADFPAATVHVHAPELAAALAPRDRHERFRYRGAQFAHGPHWRPHTADGEPWYGFRAVRELDGLPSEILLVPLAGHTRGHAGVAVATDEGWLLHAGDAFYFHGTLDATPRRPPGLAVTETVLQTQRRSRLDNQARLRMLSLEHGSRITVFCAHDATGYRQLAGRADVAR
jgi:glyoxylase-like metal-dependent hydrolase (beta-lactamase superfamily II)